MEEKGGNQAPGDEELHIYAEQLIIKEKKTTIEAIELLKQAGADHETAAIVVDNVEYTFEEADRVTREKYRKYGAYLFIGGTLAIVTNFGHLPWVNLFFKGIQSLMGGLISNPVSIDYLFWGAILYGSILYLRGKAK